MKQLKNEIRMLICTKLLSWCISISPKNNDGFKLVKAIAQYLEETKNDL